MKNKIKNLFRKEEWIILDMRNISYQVNTHLELLDQLGETYPLDQFENKAKWFEKVLKYYKSDLLPALQESTDLEVKHLKILKKNPDTEFDPIIIDIKYHQELLNQIGRRFATIHKEFHAFSVEVKQHQNSNVLSQDTSFETSSPPIVISVRVNGEISQIWNHWTLPRHIKKWNQASEDWHTTQVENDLKIKGKFNYRMEAKDELEGFNFEGTYTDIIPFQYISYILNDGREVKIEFEKLEEVVLITQTFDPETIHPVDQQKTGWQAILSNFKKYSQQINNLPLN